MTEEEIGVLGDYSEQLLISPYFNQILNEWDKATVGVMLSTKPEQQEDREHIFASVSALREFLGFMQEFVVARNKLRDPQPDDDDEVLHHNLFQ